MGLVTREIRQIANLPPEDMNREQWQRVRELVTEMNSLLALGLADTELARLGAEIINTTITAPQVTWVPLPFTTVVTPPSTINMELGTGGELGRLYYRGAAANNIEFHVTFFIDEVTSSIRYDIGMRLNGNDSTIKPIQQSSGRERFSGALTWPLDMNTDDYAEFCIRSSGTEDVQANAIVYARYSGFPAGI